MIRDEAEALAIALRYGFADVADAVRWADAVILMEPHPHSTLCDVALAAGKRKPEVVDLLHAIPGKPDHAVTTDLLIQIAHHSLIEAASFHADNVAKSLFHMAIDDLINDTDFRPVAFSSWDALHLADARIFGNREDIVKKLRNAMATAMERATLRNQWPPKTWPWR